MEPMSPALQGEFLTTGPLGKVLLSVFFILVILSVCAVRAQHGFDLHFLNDEYGEGNGTPLQYSCLENPMDGGAW